MPRIQPIHFEKLITVLLKCGFGIVRTRGDHIVLSKKGNIRPLVVPKWKEVPVFIIKNNLRSAGITRDEYLNLLKE
jgi:predicted RNA binding protein YcfA (HicA-like mRNA interferase family)